jgi:hypothetical protein
VAQVVLILAAVLGIQPAVTSVAESQTGAAPVRVLFIRGATGSAPADNVDDNQLSDIADLRNGQNTGAGYGAFAQELLVNGFEVSQIDETGTRDQPTPVDLTKVDLSQFKVVVFGSNNATTYTPADVKAVTDFVANGGGVLFNADRNWGPKTGRASRSDDQFLAAWGITEQQDNGQSENHAKADYKVPDHPIVQNIDSFGSFGVSACTVGAPPAGSGLTQPATVIIPFTSTVQVNDAIDADGTHRDPGPADGALVVAQPGQGRVACFYDRDPFFNSSLANPKNTHNGQLGLNLINWLAAKI